MIKTGKKLIVKTPKKIYNNIPRILLSSSPRTATNNNTPTNINAATSSSKDGEAWTESLLTGKSSDGLTLGVRKGFVAVYVGPGLKRFEIPAKYLSTPDFRVFMDKAAEEYGFEQEGPLELPCEVDDFVEVLSRCISRDNNKRNSGLIKM